MMKIKATVFALVLTAITVSSAFAATRHVAQGGADAGTCLLIGSPCATIAYAHSVADQGDTILLAFGTYAGVAATDITKDFITISGPVALATVKPGSGAPRTALMGAACNPAVEACITGTGLYVFGISANNVTIENLSISGTLGTTWTVIYIKPHLADTDKRDRWTIRNNYIYNAGQKNPGSARNHSFGVYGDSRLTTGTATFTGNEIKDNLIGRLGGQALAGANKTAGMGVMVQGISGESAKCTTALKYSCGLWVHGNAFSDLAVGQNSLNFTIDVNGKEPSTGVVLIQDGENSAPNSGGLIGGLVAAADQNTFAEDSFFNAGDNLDFGVVISTGDTRVDQLNASFLAAGVDTYVTNIGRAGRVNELILASFFKSLNPNVLGPGSDAYFRTKLLAESNSASTATIVTLDATATPKLTMTVDARGTAISYKVNKDSAGNLEVRAGAQLLYDGPYWTAAPVVTGVDNLILGGTSGNDLLTVDFNNGNPIPWDTDGISFDGLAGFDAITIRGDAQSAYETIQMHDSDGGLIMFEPTAGTLAFDTFTPGTTRSILFNNLEPIDDVVIVNTAFAVIAPDDVDTEINVINGPFRYGFKTFQINSGAVKTFEEVNYANKKHVHVYGSDKTGGPLVGKDIISVFTIDGETPPLMLDLFLYGGNLAANADLSDDIFVVRPSANFPITANGGAAQTDLIFLDCANTHASCTPALIAPAAAGNIAAGAITGFNSVTWSNMEATAATLPQNVDIDKVATGWAANGAHPGDELTYTVTVVNAGAAGFNTTTTPIYVTDLIDHRLSLIEQSIVVTAGTVDITGNRSMLWRVDGDTDFAVGETATLTYKVIVNTLITTVNVDNWASILNIDPSMTQWATGAPLEHYAKQSLDILDVFGFPLKAAINSSLFIQTEAGPRYIVGLHGGAKDPSQSGLGAVLCRVPSTNKLVGWDGGLGNLWYSCGKGLPNIDNIPLPLYVTDLYQDSAGRIWLTSWGNEGLFYSDDGAQTWIDAKLDISGGMGGAPDGIADGFAQVYSITEDILGTLFISANNGDIYRSFDRGTTWQKAKQLPMGSADTAFAMIADPTVPGKLFAGTFGDGMYVSSDFGETWTKPTGTGLASGYVFDLEFDPLSGNLFAGTANGLYYTADGGINWNSLNSAFPVPSHSPEVRNLSFDQNGALFASTWGQGVWASADWQALSLSLFALKASNVLNISISDNTVFALLEDGSVQSFRYTSSSLSTNIQDEVSEVPSEFVLSQNYPNPFNPTTSIEFSLPQAANVNLSVYDVIGRRVAVLVSGQMTAGRHNVNFNASNLPSGMYLYRLTTPSGAITQKMILMK